MTNTSKKIFYLLILLLPLNLGKHFELIDSYVSGLLVDYLVPTIFVQDILVFLILTFWFLEKGIPKKSEIKIFLNTKINRTLIFFSFVATLSVLSSRLVVPATYSLIRLFLYVGLFFYVTKEVKLESEFHIIVDIFSYSIIFLGILAITQFLKQGSLFNNYLFFGEQPYSASTWGVIKENVFGSARVPSYGLFRHPNTFGGFLAITLIWIFDKLKYRRRYTASFLLGIVALVLTFSYTAWFVFLIGVFLTVGKKYWNKTKVLFLIFALLFSTVMLVFPYFKNLSGNLPYSPSFYRRANLINSSLMIAKDFPFFGVGLNNFTVVVDNYTISSLDLRFTQPVHNVFLLVLSEIGVFGLWFFILFLKELFIKVSKKPYFNILFVSLIQLTTLFSLDHYLFTQHQTQLLFFLTSGLICLM